ncbi:MAG: hypothetical protein A07HR60_00945 [uncultured archaeon A07HR60]|nr:MAG: hypothetical protein J07HR59_00365 [Halorubrum sp. J07HR59]ESS12007.1 MAG: hypothetical protein A07HR60_00945 [uncultured archaeon A07HR60]
MDDKLERVIRQQLRKAGRQFEEARRAYDEESRGSRPEFTLPTDGDGNARIVCRRYAERRAVQVDAAGRPECFDVDNPDCQGCAEDIRKEVVETW